ncbi:hypothetical protein G7Y89_g13384 [Cudoniella acicularis]|uniref:Uncharacterized protein n=1 Tax=Cudoniella acicularis TaxID=354080 RepID=A0A8H4RAU5_9HELO|nr:hypothetical protein G7Y89_g13384 [Cudoniella acicularis]
MGFFSLSLKSKKSVKEEARPKRKESRVKRPRPQSAPLFPPSDPSPVSYPPPAERTLIQYGPQNQHREQSRDHIAAGPSQEYLQPEANISTTNLSTTSTLLPTPNKRYSTPEMTYEAFLSQAREDERRRAERRAREEAMVMAWIAAEERRIAAESASRSWPNDPWRGGFGPSDAERAARRVKDREARGLRPRREGSGSDGVRGWLERNRLIG